MMWVLSCLLAVFGCVLSAEPAGAARTTTVLPALDPPSGSAYCSPLGPRMWVADDGRVGGTASCYFCQGNSCTGRGHAVLWEGGPWQYLGTLGGASADATALAVGGLVAGAAQDASSAVGAFLWRDGVMEALPMPPGFDRSIALGVNSGGTVVGGVETPGMQLPVVWKNGTATVLSVASAFGYAVAVDDAGDVLVHERDDTQDQCESLRLWTASGASTLVPTQCGFDADDAKISRHGVAAAIIEGRVVRFVPGGTVDIDPGQAVPYYSRLFDVTDTGLALTFGNVPLSSPIGAFDTRSMLVTGAAPVDLEQDMPVAGGGRILVGLDMNESGQLLAMLDDERLVLLTPICGDGPDLGQPCDDGNAVQTDACKNDCTPNTCGDGVVRTGVEACDDGWTAGGCTDACALLPDTASGTVPSGGRVTTDDGVPGATPGDPIETAVTTPTGGTVTVAETGAPTPAPTGFVLLGTVVDITAPPATVADPLMLEFVLDASLVPTGEAAASLVLFRNGTVVPDCPGGLGGGAVPSPCVGLREALVDGDVRLIALTAAASQWAVGVGSTCGDGTIDPGEQCDPGADRAVDCCTPDCGLAPRGTTCRSTTGACDVAETCDGMSSACSADLRLPDVDGDGHCDGVDLCIGGEAVVSGKLKLAKLGGAAGDEKVAFKGAAPVSASIDPVADGVRLLVRAPDGQEVLNLLFPGGELDPDTKTGWTAKGVGWKYRGRGPVARVKLVRKAGVLTASVAVRAVAAIMPVGPGLDAVLQLNPSAGGSGPCLEARFPACRVGNGGSTRSCN